MADLQTNGLYFCRACERGDLTRDDFYTDRSKKYELSRFCRQCEGDRTRQAKHEHYMRSGKYKQSQRRRTKRAYYLRHRREILSKSTQYKRNNPGRVRAYLLKRKYKLTPEERQDMIEEQRGCCLICGEEQWDKLEVDHDHSTGKVRAMLCHNCNSGLGMFGDSVELLSIAYSYLYHFRDL